MKLGSKVNMCSISIIILAGHHWAYESLMISVYLGRYYSTKDAAPACTVLLKRSRRWLEPKEDGESRMLMLKTNI